MYNLIGDSHGHSEPLARLLDKLGYAKTAACFDTLKVTGSIAEARSGVPTEIRREALGRMDDALPETHQRFLSQTF